VAEQGWDVDRYDRSFRFVSRYGRDLVTLLDPVPGERVLDLGCGTGELAAELADLGVVAHGIDADESMIEQARAKHPHVVFEQGDGHDFALTEPVDAVLSNAALHWMLEPGAVVARVKASLRPGGRFVAEFGGQGNVETIRSAVREAAQAVGVDEVSNPWFFPSPAEYARLLEDGGFRVRLIEHFDRLTPLDDCPDGVVDWLRMFGAELLAGIPSDLREHVMREAAERCSKSLLRKGRWYADYVRLRVWAQVPERA
jgi:trans-aconitate methyltransferase